MRVIMILKKSLIYIMIYASIQSSLNSYEDLKKPSKVLNY